MKYLKTIGYFLLLFSITTSALAKKNPYEIKGRFGVVIHDNFVTLNYVLTYLNESHKPGHLAFRLDIEDSKGLDLFYEIDESECILKNSSDQKLDGKIERVSDNTVILLFSYDDSFKKTKNLTLYTVIRDYKLKKKFSL